VVVGGRHFSTRPGRHFPMSGPWRYLLALPKDPSMTFGVVHISTGSHTFLTIPPQLSSLHSRRTAHEPVSSVAPCGRSEGYRTTTEQTKKCEAVPELRWSENQSSFTHEANKRSQMGGNRPYCCITETCRFYVDKNVRKSEISALTFRDFDRRLELLTLFKDFFRDLGIFEKV